MIGTNSKILSGGYFRCTQEWNTSANNNRDNYFKLYFPIEGFAKIKLDGQWFDIAPGNAYFINGYMLEGQECDSYMTLYWLHFLPESFQMNMYLNTLEPIHSLPLSDKLLSNFDYTSIVNLINLHASPNVKCLDNEYLSLTCYVNSIIMACLSTIIKQQNKVIDNQKQQLMLKMQPAIDYINKNYFCKLSLEDISKQLFLNPSYFLRLFKKCYNMTPNRYINSIRLNEACSMLTRTNRSISEISEATGFSNQFYFSKIFKENFNLTPSEYRNKKLTP